MAEYLGLTTVRQALFESGRQSVACLWTAVAGEAGRVDQVTLPTELVIRRTTAAPPRERR